MKDREKANAAQRAYRKRHPERIKALKKINRLRRDRSTPQRAVERAIGRGAIIRQPCVICGEAKSHAHHCDYTQPFQLMWLCPKHHYAWHRVFVADGLNFNR